MNGHQQLKKFLGIVMLVCLVVGFSLYQNSANKQQTSPPTDTSTDAQLAELFHNQATGVQVSGSGTVSRILADDDDGSRHQRFILELDSGQTLLIAHNIDIAPRLDGVQVGDRVSFYGEYAYSDQGGTIHWTHHDPQGQHAAGWLEWKGQKYQ